MKFEPHPYQAYCIRRMVEDPALALWLDMGLGKTVVALTAIAHLRYAVFAVRKALVVAPKKVAEATWQKEAGKWDHLGLLRISTILGAERQRVRAINTPADVYVINRENVAWLVNHYRNAWPFDMVVLDEASSFKKHQAQRWKALKSIRPHIARLVELTGTPAPNGLMDLWAQIYLLDGGQRLGKTLGQYRERYFDPDKRSREQIFSWAAKEGSREAVHRALSDLCVSMKAEDYLTLPDCVTVDVPVALDAKARRAYEKLEREMLLEVDEQTIDAGSAAVLTGKLLQLCNGAVYDENRQPVELHRGKVDALLELVEGLQGQPVLVFYQFQHDRDRLLKALAPTGLRVRVYRGPQDEADWNDRKVDVLLAHPASCAYGLNLQAGGSNIIWFGLTWSLEQYQQANKRLHRQGQQRPVVVHRLAVTGCMDEDVLNALEEKWDTQEGLLQALKARIERVRGVGAGAPNRADHLLPSHGPANAARSVSPNSTHLGAIATMAPRAISNSIEEEAGR